MLQKKLQPFLVSMCLLEYIDKLSEMEYLISIIVPLAFFAAIVILTTAYLNFIVRARIIKSKENNPEVLRLLTQTLQYRISNLKWGILLLFGGLGFIVIYFLPESCKEELHLCLGIEMVSLSLGFLLYYIIAKRTVD